MVSPTQSYRLQCTSHLNSYRIIDRVLAEVSHTQHKLYYNT